MDWAQFDWMGSETASTELAKRLYLPCKVKGGGASFLSLSPSYFAFRIRISSLITPEAVGER